MTNPRTLLLAIAATACGLLLTLIGASDVAPAAPLDGVAMTASQIAEAVQDAMRQEPAAFASVAKPVPWRVTQPIDGDTAHLA